MDTVSFNNRRYAYYIIQKEKWSIKILQATPFEKVEGERLSNFVNYSCMYRKGWGENAAQTITFHQYYRRLYLIKLCYTLGRRDFISVKSVDNYSPLIVPS